MAIGQIYNTLTYGGINSGDYGIYITGEAVYDAPEKNVTVISVPARNGDIIIDKGNFANIDVKYKAGTFGADQQDFRQRLGRFRNALKAQSGYQRLTDTYHPEQYRMGIFNDAFEVKAEQGVAGEFELVFNCKPQRWLTDGEAPVVVADGDTLSNPTLFESEPLLAIEGSGLVKFNGYEINLINPVIGDVNILEPFIETYDRLMSDIEKTVSIGDIVNAGDTITMEPLTFMWDLVLPNYLPYTEDASIGSITVTDSSLTHTTIMGRDPYPQGVAYIVHMRTVIDTFDLPSYWATQSTGRLFTVGLDVNYRHGGALTVSGSALFQILTSYDDTTGKMTFTFSRVTDDSHAPLEPLYINPLSLSTGGAMADSTVYLLGDPTYLDCELGEAYKIENGEIISLNQHIDMGSRLPRLVPGDTEFEITGNITECKVTPRWWEL